MSATSVVSTLKDFDWSVKLVLSSDKLSDLRQPLLQLKLTSLLPNGDLKENLLELDITEARYVLENLKKIKLSLDSMKS